MKYYQTIAKAVTVEVEGPDNPTPEQIIEIKQAVQDATKQIKWNKVDMESMCTIYRTEPYPLPGRPNYKRSICLEE